jgi:CDK-activating kinase assembly factor MAT1
LYEEAQKAERNPNATIRTFQSDPSLPSDTAQVVLKKGAAQRKGPAAGSTPDPFSDGAEAKKDTGFTFRGLKKYVPPAPEKLIDPFGGWRIEPKYYVLQDDYDVEWLTKSKEDPQHYIGGYDMQEFYSRALCEAFSGFGVFIDEELDARENGVSGNAVVGTQNAVAAAAGGKDVNMDDVF